MRCYPFSILPTVLVLGGCYAPDRDLLAREVTSAVQRSTSPAAAEAALRIRGFDCGSYIVGGASCTRDREYKLIASCRERVNLMTVVKKPGFDIEVPNVACASL